MNFVNKNDLYRVHVRVYHIFTTSNLKLNEDFIQYERETLH